MVDPKYKYLNKPFPEPFFCFAAPVFFPSHVFCALDLLHISSLPPCQLHFSASFTAASLSPPFPSPRPFLLFFFPSE